MNAMLSPSDFLELGYCCLNCMSKFAAKNLLAIDTLRCPHCRSDYVHPIERGPLDVVSYCGEIGTLH
jgi:hypothetical protein